MLQNAVEYTILDAVTPVAITSSTDATPIVVTATSHGFVTGDKVMIQGHTTNIAANGIYLITKLTDNTFSLQDINTHQDIAGSGAGAGASGIVFRAPKTPLVFDFRHYQLAVRTSGTSTMTIKVAGSAGKVDGTPPNFGGTRTSSNPYSFLNLIDLEDGQTVTEGDTGIVLAGSDIQKDYEININRIKYVSIFPTAWTQGALTVKLSLFGNLQ